MTEKEPNAPTASFTDDRMDMAYWYPEVEDIDVPTPETRELELQYQENSPPEWDTNQAVDIVSDLGGEAFVRSGYKSAQMGMGRGGHNHSSSPEVIDRTLTELISQHAMMQMPLGESLWVREWLDLNWCNYARENLVPECRVFIRDNEVVCHHPRLEGFKSHSDHRETAIDRIESAWPKDSEHGYYRDEPIEVYAERVANQIDGAWSVDFVCDTSGKWWLTDMALDALYDLSERGEDGYRNISEHPGDCEHDLMKQL